MASLRTKQILEKIIADEASIIFLDIKINYCLFILMRIVLSGAFIYKYVQSNRYPKHPFLFFLSKRFKYKYTYGNKHG